MIAIPNMEKPKNCGMCQLADKWADDNDNVTIECLIGHTFNDCPLIEIDDEIWEALKPKVETMSLAKRGWITDDSNTYR